MKNLQYRFDEFFKSQDMNKCKEFVFKYKYLHRAFQNVNLKLNAIEAHHHWNGQENYKFWEQTELN